MARVRLCKEGHTEVCGTEFGKECGIVPNAIYTCSGDRSKPAKKEQCQLQCGIDESGKITCLDQECKCKGNMTLVCGDAFLDDCGYTIEAFYKCSGAGTHPQLQEDCGENKCRGGPSNAHCTKNECLCTDTMKDVCGAGFPATCGYDPNTIYTCTLGNEPVEKKGCKPHFCQLGTCVPNECLCKRASETLCGSNFPPSCSLGEDTIYVCSAVDAEPKKMTDCKPGECIDKDGAARCGNRKCECNKDMTQICGWIFPAECLLDSQKLYTCSGEGTNPVEKEDCSATACILDPVAKEAACKIDECKCQEALGTFCSQQFPERCGHGNQSIMTCNKKGDDPKATVNCWPTECELTPIIDAPRCREDPCACKPGMGSVCSAAFPTDCKYEENKVYICVNTKLRPQVIEDCKGQRCVFDGSTSKCTIDECACKDGMSTVCASNFPLKCNMNSTGLYFCENTGEQPKQIKECGPWACQYNDATGISKCENNPCLCNATDTRVCGSVYPDVCKLHKDTLYSCTGDRATPIPVEDCKPEHCEVDNSGAAQCHINECMCPSALATICGNAFPTQCGLKLNAVYTCPGPKQPPKEITDCGKLGCIVEQGGKAKCQDDPCKCKLTDATVPFQVDVVTTRTHSTIVRALVRTLSPLLIATAAVATRAPVHASSIPASAEAAARTIMFAVPSWASSAAFTTRRFIIVPRREVVLFHGSFANVDASSTLAHAFLSLKTRVFARMLKVYEVTRCGSAFPLECAMDGDTLYACSGPGTKPNKYEKCIAGGCISGTRECAPDPCACSTAGMFCGKDYPPTCGYNRDKIYICNRPKEYPTPSEDCPAARCDASSGSAVCKADCTCPDNMKHCGSIWDKSCVFDSQTLYACSGKGANPVPNTLCDTTACNENINDCNPDPCKCTVVGDVCGRDFPKDCGDVKNNTVYYCQSVGKRPTMPGKDCESDEVCRGGKCQSTNCVCPGNGAYCTNELNCPGLAPNVYYSCYKGTQPVPIGTCTNGKPTNNECLCKDRNSVCSSAFPAYCGYGVDQQLSCVKGAGTRPEFVKQCGYDRCKSGACQSSCSCFRAGQIRGREFDSACGFNPSAIYTCVYNPFTGWSMAPIGVTCPGVNRCVVTAGVGRCLRDCDCLSILSQECGSSFPKSCGFDMNSLYTCDLPGTTPRNPKKCPNGCQVRPGEDGCLPDFT
ncbi:hypothetical protein BGZ81_004549 [Podila clonocystis]|nr:hypothetical protein BGZ81_004549 [Podila clonocystis]